MLSTNDVITLVVSIIALSSSVYALVKAHTNVAAVADKVVTAPLTDPALMSAIEKLAASFPPDTLKTLSDMGLLLSKVTADVTPKPPSIPTPPAAA